MQKNCVESRKEEHTYETSRRCVDLLTSILREVDLDGSGSLDTLRDFIVFVGGRFVLRLTLNGNNVEEEERTP
jgi:hypothetical protein